ncbi:hypothetical protein AB0M20_25395 [Actinoplanes sp. NPDC051633]|uniref:hypothetical protein n=1 Tax=Actinoplanes sp. NPDC051633 TaxID=3155670 RepID=UPI0034188B53
MGKLRGGLVIGAAVLLCVWILWLFGGSFGFTYEDPAAPVGEAAPIEVTCDSQLMMLFGPGQDGASFNGSGTSLTFVEIGVACNAARGARAGLAALLAVPTAVLLSMLVLGGRRLDRGGPAAEVSGSRLRDLHRLDDDA